MTRVVLAVGLVALLSAGCGGDSEAAPLPPVTATSSAVVTPSVSAFPETPQGAADFARFFYAEANRAYSERDPAVLKPYFAAACSACERYANTLERLQRGDITIEGAGLAVLSAETPGGATRGVTVSLRLQSAGTIFRDRSGAITTREPAGEVQGEMSLTRSGPNWLVREIAFVR